MKKFIEGKDYNYSIKTDKYDNVSEDGRDVMKCTICKKNEAIEDFVFPTNDSVSRIVTYIKYILGEVYGSEFRQQINSIKYKFRNKFHRNSFLELFLNKPQKKSVQENEIIHTRICEVPATCIRRKVKLVASQLKGKGLNIILEEKPNPIRKDKTINKQKILCFFPKLLTKIASKSDKLVKKTLISKQSLFILSCTARLAWKFNNIDAFALFKLSAVEIKRGDLNQAFVYYKQARSSLSEMIFQDKIFSFLFNGKTELTIIKELTHSEAKYFLYRQTNIALMSDNSIYYFTFHEMDHTKLNNTEIDGEKALKSLNYLEDQEKIASIYGTKFTSNSDERGKN